MSRNLSQKSFHLLTKALNSACPTPQPLFVDPDRDASGSYARDAGLLLAIDYIAAALAAHEKPPAILLMGILDPLEFRGRASTIPGALRVLDWQGVLYLRYVFDRAELAAAAMAALAGRAEPFPSVDLNELCAQLADVRHWLERFRLNAVGAFAIVADVATGSLPATALSPQQWLSEKHQASLNRLFAALKLSQHPADGGRLAQARDAFQEAALTFEEHKVLAAADQYDLHVHLPGLSTAATALVTCATEISFEVSRLDSQICKDKAPNRGSGFDEDTDH